MATERLIVEISEKGALVVKRKIGDIGKEAKKSNDGVSLLKRGLGLLASAAIVKGITSYADAFTTLQNRIRVVTNGTDELSVVTKELFDISRATRSSVEATAEVYSRFALAAKDLGISQRETLDFTKSLNQAVILSGASATEAQAGLIQLSQGLASGALRGDELRSVLEQLPVVADVISKELGVTRGELRVLGAEGKITADIVLNSFKNAADELDQNFGKTVPTIGQSFGILRNEVLKFVGDLDSGTGASQALARGIVFIAENLNKLKPILEFIEDVGVAVFEEIRAAIDPILPSLDSVQSVAGSVFKQVGLLAIALVQTILEGFDATARSIGQFLKLLDDNFRDVIGGLTQFFLEFVNTSLGLVQGLINGIITGINATREFLGQNPLSEIELFQFDTLAATEAGLEIGDKIREGLLSTDLAGALDNVIDRVTKAQARRNFERSKQPGAEVDLTQSGENVAARNKQESALRKQAEAFAEVIDALQTESELLRLNSREREVQAQLLDIEADLKGNLTDAQRAEVEALVRLNQELALEAELLEAIKGPQEQYNLDIQALNSLLDQGKINAAEYRQALKDLAPPSAVEDVDLLATTITGVWDGAFDSLLTFTEGGTVLFRDFATNVLSSIGDILAGFIKLKAQQFLLNAFAPGAGALAGANAGANFQVRGTGGVDSQLVAFRATPGENVSVTTSGQQAQQSGKTDQGGAVPITVAVVIDRSEIQSVLKDSEGRKVIVEGIRLERNTVKQVIAS